MSLSGNYYARWSGSRNSRASKILGLASELNKLLVACAEVFVNSAFS